MSAHPKKLLASTAIAWAAAISAAMAQTSQGAGQAQPLPMPQLSPLVASSLFLMSSTQRQPSSLRPIRETVVSGNVQAAMKDTDVSSFSGKLHITINGDPHYCSGLFVHENVVLTAAHCVQQNGTTTQYHIERFVREGAAPGEEFLLTNQSCVEVPSQWTTQTDDYLRINYDYAFLKVAAAGSTPAITNLKVRVVKQGGDQDPFGKQIKAYGYPNSQNQALTAIGGDAVRDALHPLLLSLNTNSLGFTEGTSGGAWVRNEGSAGQPFRVVSVNSSYGIPVYDKTRIWIYGPNFERDVVKTHFESARDC